MLRTSGGGTLSTAVSWTNNGTLHLAADVTPFESKQNYTQSDTGVLVVEVAGAQLGESGRLNVAATILPAREEVISFQLSVFNSQIESPFVPDN